MESSDCGHTRAQHCACPPCSASCSARQAEDSTPFVWPIPIVLPADSAAGDDPIT